MKFTNNVYLKSGGKITQEGSDTNLSEHIVKSASPDTITISLENREGLIEYCIPLSSIAYVETSKDQKEEKTKGEK